MTEEPQSNTIRVMIVDDHHLVRQGLAALLSTESRIEVVGQGADGTDAIHLYANLLPDVTLMDLRMPAIGGVEAIKQIRRDFPAAKFIVLTTFDGDEDIYRAFQAGAQSYLLKGMSFDVLIEAILSVAQGKKTIPPAVAAKLAERMGIEELTGRELQVLNLIVKGGTNKEIGIALDISEATVKSHVNSILGKLGVADRTQAVTTALQRGLVQLNEQ